MPNKSASGCKKEVSGCKHSSARHLPTAICEDFAHELAALAIRAGYMTSGPDPAPQEPRSAAEYNDMAKHIAKNPSGLNFDLIQTALEKLFKRKCGHCGALRLTILGVGKVNGEVDLIAIRDKLSDAAVAKLEKRKACGV